MTDKKKQVDELTVDAFLQQRIEWIVQTRARGCFQVRNGPDLGTANCFSQRYDKLFPFT